MEEFIHKPFNEETEPLWRSCLLTNNSEKTITSQDSKSLENECHFILGIHHGISDGIANLKIMETFLLILDNLLSDKTISLEQTGVFHLGKTDTEKLMDERRKEIENSLDLDKKLKKTKRMLTEIITPWTSVWKENPEERTFHVEGQLNATQTSSLLDTFKQHGISVNSGFSAIVNVMLVEILRKNGVKSPIHEVGVFHGINERQFWKNKTEFAYGTHVAFMKVYTNTSQDSAKDFWAYAQNLHKDVQNKIQTFDFIDEEILKSILYKDFTEKDLHFVFQGLAPLGFYYSISNLGNLDTMVKDVGCNNNVIWDSLTRTISVHYLNSPMCFNFHCFKGLFSYSIEYNIRFVSHGLAKILLDNLSTILQKLPSGKFSEDT